MPTIITNENIHDLVRIFIIKKYYETPKVYNPFNPDEPREELPIDLQSIPIGKWDVSRVTKMSFLFADWDKFNEPLNDWDVSNVRNMSYMFRDCKRFNQPLDKWDVLNVTHENGMEGMFMGCKKFNQDLSNLDVYNVKNMSYMFCRCKIFNKNPEWIINEETKTKDMFLGTPLKNVKLEKTKIRYYNVAKANRDVENTITELSKTNLPGELIEEITTYFDPEMATKSRKTLRDKSHPGGGGYAGGRRKRTQKRNNRKL
jgi:surface protein